MSIPNDVILIAEMLTKLSAIERLLIKNNLITKEDFATEIKKISEEIVGIFAQQSIVESNK
jgi:hypothetical protein